MPENIIADHSTASSTACRVADPFRRILVGSNLVGSNGMASNIRLRLFILSVPHRVALIQINGCFEPPRCVDPVSLPASKCHRVVRLRRTT